MPQEKTFWKFQNSTESANEATLYIYGDIMQYDLEWWNYPDDVIPHRFRQDLDALENVKTIHVRINSGGGSVFGAYAIMNLLKSHPAQIITYNDGIAASAATLIAMAGDKVVSSLGSIWMVHLPSTSVVGNANELVKAVDILRTITESMIDIYNQKTGIERSEIEKMLNEDTWMTGKEAKEKGFVDEVTDLEITASIGADNHSAKFGDVTVNLSRFQNHEKLRNILKNNAKPTSVDHHTNTQDENRKEHNEENTMNVEDLKAKHPELYQSIFDEGVTAERSRIKEIDAMAIPGTEDSVNKAKFETGVSAAECAFDILKAQKQKGADFLNAIKHDAKDVEGVQPTPNNGGNDDAAEEAALLAYLAALEKK